jgi:hypothetical protein
MLSSKPSNGAKRWPRGQKFTLSAMGGDAEEAYRSTVLASRSSGRAALDAALTAWAAPRGVVAADGVILTELSGKRLGIGDLCERLEAAGFMPEEVRAGLGRLVEAGVVEPVPLASQVG